MNLLHRVTDEIATFRRQAAIRGALSRLGPRSLADLGVAREDIRAVARQGARMGAAGVPLADVVARVHAARHDRPTFADRAFAALERMSVRQTETLTYSNDLDRYLAEAHRLRAETMSGFGQWLGRRVQELFAPVVAAVRESEPGRRARVALVWRRAHRQMQAELATYSDRELMTDLRLNSFGDRRHRGRGRRRAGQRLHRRRPGPAPLRVRPPGAPAARPSRLR